MTGESELMRRVEAAALMSAYAGLLTARQADVLTLYYEEDLSLSEIAAQTGVSRQSVHDTLTRAVRDMETYERKLGLVWRVKRAEHALREAENAVLRIPAGENQARALQSLREALQALDGSLSGAQPDMPDSD